MGCSDRRGSPQKGSPPWLWSGVAALSQDVAMSKGTPGTVGCAPAPLSAVSMWNHGGVSKAKRAAALLIPGTEAISQKLWPRLEGGKGMVNWDGKFMVWDWEQGGRPKCLVSLFPFFLMAHTVLWPCSTFALPCVQQHFGFLDSFSSSKKKKIFFTRNIWTSTFSRKRFLRSGLFLATLRHKSQSWPLHY